MIDIHSHILFEVDDGADNLEVTRQMLQMAYQQGIRTIVATPHQRKGMFETSQEEIVARYQDTVAIAREVAEDLTILLGNEIYFTPDVVDRLEKGNLLPLAHTRYLLVEFSTRATYQEITKAVKGLLRLGYGVVIAHLERYATYERHLDQVAELIRMGALIQVNASSVMPTTLFDKKRARKKLARRLLDKQYVHFIASDAHNMNARPYEMAQAYQAVAKQYGTASAKRLFKENQQQLLKK